MKVGGRRAHLSHASVGHPQADRPLRLSLCDWKAGSNRIQSAGWSAASPSIIGLVKKECASMISSESSSFQISFWRTLP
jgi:hypothetical protein